MTAIGLAQIEVGNSMSRNEDLAAFGISQSEDGVRLSQTLPELLLDGLGALLSIDADFARGVDDTDLISMSTNLPSDQESRRHRATVILS